MPSSPTSRRWSSRRMAIVERPSDALALPSGGTVDPQPARRVRPADGQDRLALLGHHRRPQEDRHHVRRLGAGLPRDRRPRGAAHPVAAGRAGPEAAVGRPLQPGLHDARRHDDLPGRHADGRGVHELPDPAADRRPRRRLPAAQRAQLLDVPRRRHLPQHVVVPRRRRRRRLVRLRPEHRRDLLAQPRHGLLRHRPADHRHRVARRRREPGRHRAQPAGAGHDAHAHAGVHVDELRHPGAAGVRHAGDLGGAVPAHLRPALRRQLLQRQRRAPTRCCGSTCSGSSGTPRCTS